MGGGRARRRHVQAAKPLLMRMPLSATRVLHLSRRAGRGAQSLPRRRRCGAKALRSTTFQQGHGWSYRRSPDRHSLRGRPHYRQRAMIANGSASEDARWPPRQLRQFGEVCRNGSDATRKISEEAMGCHELDAGRGADGCGAKSAQGLWLNFRSFYIRQNQSPLV